MTRTKGRVSIPSVTSIKIPSQHLDSRLHTHLSTTHKVSGCSILPRLPSMDKPSTKQETPPLLTQEPPWLSLQMLHVKQSMIRSQILHMTQRSKDTYSLAPQLPTNSQWLHLLSETPSLRFKRKTSPSQMPASMKCVFYVLDG